jgi:hypothetical protein
MSKNDGLDLFLNIIYKDFELFQNEFDLKSTFLFQCELCRT